jgi:2-oxoglutarate dehydrogenase E2 component (dihydrolipoamide succinyltransferase)
MTDLIDVRLDAESLEGTQSVLSGWLKQAGDPVRAHEPIAELETDKVVVELAAPADGVLVELLKEAGQEVLPDDVVARIRTDASAGECPETAETSAAAAVGADAAATSEQRPRLSPAVRRMLKEHQLNSSDIDGTGRDGRVTARDIERHLASRKTAKSAAVGRVAGAGESRRVPHDNMRLSIARHMVESLMQTAPHVTAVFEADMSAVINHRRAHKADFAARGASLTVTAYLLEAAARALAAVPEVNSSWHDDALELFDDINIGIGTALDDKGLIVPVLRRVQDLNLFDISAGLDLLTRKARDNALAPGDVRGGTFTISNHGVSGSLIATPVIINQPQSAILGVGKITKRVVVRELDGEDVIQVRPMCYISLTIDHRVLDAYQTNRFLTILVETLENYK